MEKDRLKWLFELYDRMSAPAGRIASSLGRVQGALRAVTAGGRTVKDFMGGLADGMRQGWSEMVPAVAVGSLLANALSAMARAALEAGVEVFKFALEQATARDTIQTTATAMWGAAGAAEVWGAAVKTATGTATGVNDVARAFSYLKAAGYGLEEVPIVMRAIQDVAALSGFKNAPATIEKMTAAFAALRERPVADFNVLGSAAASVGIRLADLYEEVARRRGIKEPGSPMALNMIHVAAQAGQVSGDEAGFAFLHALRKRVGGGMVGAFSDAQGRSLGGAQARLRANLENIFGAEGGSRGVEAMRSSLNNLADALTVAGEAGTGGGNKIAHAFDRALQILFKGFEGPEGMRRIEFIINSVSTAMEGFAWILRGVGSVLGAIWEALYQIGDEIAQFASDVVDAGRKIADFFGGLGQRFKTIGGEIGDGTQEGFRQALGIHSPSRVFRELGRYSLEGYEQGLGDLSLGGGPVQTLGVQAPSGGGRGINVHLEQHIAASPGMDIRELADVAAQRAQAAIVDILEGLALEGGAT